MNITELQSHFYKRFTGENGRVVLSEAGLPCSLIGYVSTDIMPSISCPLSMRINIIARKIGSNTVTITSTSSDMLRVYSLDSRDRRDRISAFIDNAHDFGLRGSQLLCDNNIPQCFDPHIAYTAAVAKALLELSKRGMPRPEVCASLCAQKDETNEYMSVFSSRKGYCVYSREDKTRNLPLPMTGFKFILVHVKDAASPVSPAMAEKTYMLLKELYPHITSLADISPEMLDLAGPRIKSHETRMCARHLANECRLIRGGVRALTRCNIKEFGALMNESCYSQKRMCAYNDSRLFVADELMSSEGVIGARMCENGIIAIVEEDFCNVIMKSLKFVYETEFGYAPVFCVADGM